MPIVLSTDFTSLHTLEPSNTHNYISGLQTKRMYVLDSGTTFGKPAGLRATHYLNPSTSTYAAVSAATFGVTSVRLLVQKLLIYKHRMQQLPGLIHLV